MKTLLLLILSWFNSTSLPAAPQTTVPTYKIVEYQDASYGYGIFSVSENQKLKLIPNYDVQEASEKLIAENNCSLAINGGFYAQDNTPLGLVLADSTEFSKARSSDLFNGFLSVSADDHNLISDTYPGSAKIILQSGPRLIINQKIVNLNLHDDKLARRTVAATTAAGQLVFMTIFHSQTEMSGPLLENLPTLVQMVASREQLQINEAVNLDGGNASMFHSPALSLAEVNSIGSMFCVQGT